MHLYGIVRGREDLVRRFRENCEDVFLPSGHTIKLGKKIQNFTQLVARKVELVEFVFPEPYLPEVLKTVTGWGDTTGMQKSVLATTLRKVLRSKAIPQMDLKKIKPLTCRGGASVSEDYVSVTPIGIKTDLKDEDGNELL